MTPEYTKALLDYWMDGVVPGAEVVAASRPGGAKVLDQRARAVKAKAVIEKPVRRDPALDLRPARPPLPLRPRRPVVMPAVEEVPVSGEQAAATPSRPSATVRRAAVDLPVGRLRAQQRAAEDAERADRVVPDAFPGALRFVASGRWSHVSFAASLGNYTHLERLASGLVARGPWVALTASVRPLPDSSGLCELIRSESGEEWIRLSVDRVRSGGDLRSALRHEIGHVAYELAEFERTHDAGVWRAGLPDRARPSEPFAIWCETNIGERTTVDDLVAAANDFVRRSSRLPPLNSVRTNRKKA